MNIDGVESKNESKFDNENSNNRPKPKRLILENDIGIYDGEVNSKCLRHGYGVYRWKKTNDIYEGYWEDNLRNGNGEYLYSDGSIYRGQWKNDSKNGKGSYKFNGFEFDGEWDNDHLSNGFVFKINKLELDLKDNMVDLNDEDNNFSILENKDYNYYNEVDYTDESLEEELKSNLERIKKFKPCLKLNIEVKSYKRNAKKEESENIFESLLSLFERVKKVKSKESDLKYAYLCDICNNFELSNENFFNCHCQKVVKFLNNYMTS